jgi:hypothetical protein
MNTLRDGSSEYDDGANDKDKSSAPICNPMAQASVSTVRVGLERNPIPDALLKARFAVPTIEEAKQQQFYHLAQVEAANHAKPGAYSMWVPPHNSAAILYKQLANKTYVPQSTEDDPISANLGNMKVAKLTGYVKPQPVFTIKRKRVPQEFYDSLGLNNSISEFVATELYTNSVGEIEIKTVMTRESFEEKTVGKYKKFETNIWVGNSNGKK